MKFAINLVALVAVMISGSMSSAQQCSSSNAGCQNSATYVRTSRPMTYSKNIVQTAASVEDFSTLVSAVKAAGLADALQGDGPFTVFAPTNAAFEKLPAGTVETLLKPENKEKLAAILKYHVVSGKIMAGDILKAASVKTLQGSTAAISLNIGNARIVKTDIGCSNGVIHVIDSVILPE